MSKSTVTSGVPLGHQRCLRSLPHAFASDHAFPSCGQRLCPRLPSRPAVWRRRYRGRLPPGTCALTEVELFQLKSLDALNAEHPLGDAFFDYAQDTLRDNAKRALQQDAQ